MDHEINLNDTVMVRLTDKGRQVHRSRYDSLCAAYPNSNLQYSPPKEDADGWSRWVLHHLMNTFGSDLCPGCIPPMEMVIRIDIKDRDDQLRKTAEQLRKERADIIAEVQRRYIELQDSWSEDDLATHTEMLRAADRLAVAIREATEPQTITATSPHAGRTFDDVKTNPIDGDIVELKETRCRDPFYPNTTFEAETMLRVLAVREDWVWFKECGAPSLASLTLKAWQQRLTEAISGKVVNR